MISKVTLGTISNSAMNGPKALQWCGEIFGGLSRYWLSTNVLEVAHALDNSNPDLTFPEPPGLAGRRGGCLLVLRNSGDYSVLRRAVVLPLLWRPDKEHSASLPESLRTLADRVLAAVRQIREIQAPKEQRWGLSIDPSICLPKGGLDDDLFETFESGWASLAVGLIAAMQGLEPDMTVWSSAAWNRQYGIGRVDGLLSKIETAIEFGANFFFLPVWQKSEIEGERPELASRIHLMGLASGIEPGNLWLAVQPMLGAFTRAPKGPESADDEKQIAICVNYYLNQPARSEKQLNFYRTHLFHWIVCRCRDAVRKQYPNFSAQHLVTLVSGEKEITLISILALGVDKCLLLHTDDKRQAELAADIQSQLKSQREAFERFGFKVPSIQLAPFPNDHSMLDRISVWMLSVSEHCESAQMVIDIKPGTKKMSYAIATNERAGNWIYHLNQEFRNNLPLPFSERPELWQSTRTTFISNG